MSREPLRDSLRMAIAADLVRVSMNSTVNRPQGRDDVSEELIDQDLFLYDEGTGTVHQLNSGAAMVWLLCDGTRDVDEIVGEIATSSSVDTNQVMPDVQEALEQFADLGLLANG